MDWHNVEFVLHTVVDNFNDHLITKKDFCEKFLNDIHPFKDGNGRNIICVGFN